MMTALTVAILVAGFALSVWAAGRVSRSLVGESTEQQLRRQERMIRRVITALGCGFTVLIVGAIWLQRTVNEAHRATEIGLQASATALEAARSNCISQQEAQAANERALIADVRLATAQYQGAVDALLDLDNRIQTGALPDPVALAPEIQEWLKVAEQQGYERLQADRTRLDGLRQRWEDELGTRQEALDEARTRRITSCPQPRVVVDGDVVVEVTTTTT
jgi:thymidylate kinase